MEIRFQVAGTQSWLTSLFRDQLPFANSLALNRTGLAVQKAERAGISERFIIRRPWVTQGITIPRFSDKHDQPLKITIALDVTRAFLAKFEPGGAKTETAAGPIAIPSTALRPSV